MTTETYSDQTIRAYLLGQLPEAETERLDELSITDDECAERIRAVEHDLVDAFARGELEGVALERFRSTYLATARGRDSIRFAEALQSLDETSGSGGPSAAGRRQTTLARSTRNWPLWLATAAAAVFATAATWLVSDNRMLRERVTSDELRHDRQLREAEARGADTARRLSTGPGPSLQAIATLVLAPQLRGARQLPTVALAPAARELTIQLDLEPVDYPSYTAALVASSEDRMLWQSDRLVARAAGDRQRIELGLPATVLSPRDYLIRVSGVPVRGPAEIVGEYRFSVVR
jgi:hypothetical protein